MADTDWPKLAYRIDEAAKIMSVSRTTLYRFIAAGKLRTFTIGRCRVISAKSLRALIEKDAP